MRRHGIEDLHRLVIVHDELDLPAGRIKVKVGGGLAGNNGLKSIKAHLHTDDFVRVRIGVGKPPGPPAGRRPRAAPARQGRAGRARRRRSQEAADAVELILADGPEAAMNRFNGAADRRARRYLRSGR